MRDSGRALVEIHGQHDDRALVDARRAPRAARCLRRASRRGAAAAPRPGRTGATASRSCAPPRQGRGAAREADYLRASVDELEARPAARRGDRTCRKPRRMMRAEKIASEIKEAQDILSGQCSPLPQLASLLRRLERKSAEAPGLLDDAVQSLDEALLSLDAAQIGGRCGAPSDRIRSTASWRGPRSGCLRCAPLRANISVPVDDLPGLRERCRPISPISTPARSAWRA